jgi:hypothetical protein
MKEIIIRDKDNTLKLLEPSINGSWNIYIWDDRKWNFCDNVCKKTKKEMIKSAYKVYREV